jgi:hypothetical protein
MSTLIWLVLLSVICGFITCALITGSTIKNREYEAYQHGFQDGYKQGVEKGEGK